MKQHYENNELGKIFRSKLDAHEVPFNPAHWQQLQAKMQAEQGGAVSFAKWWRYAAVLLLGTSFVASVWWVTQNNEPVVVEKPIPATPVTPTPATEINNRQSTSTPKDIVPSITATNETIDKPASNQSESIVTTIAKANTPNGLSKSTANRKGIRNHDTDKTVFGISHAEQKSTTQLNNQATYTDNYDTKQSVVSIEKIDTKGLSPLGFINLNDTLKNKGKIIPLQQLPTTTPNEPALVRNNLNNFGNFRVGVVAMPYMQWSNVYNAQNQQFEAVDKKVVGLQGGVNVGMSITNWLSIETGVWLNKYEISNFYAQPLPFKPIYGDSLAAKYLFENNNKEVVNYKQTTLLFPISARVDVLAHEQNRFFVKGTLLNQLIVQETSMYELSYSQIYIFPSTQLERKSLIQGEMTNNSQMLWANSVQLQIGYERKISEHFAVQVEPFLRLPLKTEGMNQLNNYSTGLALQVSYGF